MHENQEKSQYETYRESGGVFDEQDYNEILGQNENMAPDQRILNKQREMQAEEMAKLAGIDLNKIQNAVEVYGVLRSTPTGHDAENHHSQMPDQSLFAEALRISGNMDELYKLIEKYHKAGQYCPICLKVPKTGEGCR